jgi:UDP-N-acetylmuramate--alanine ligase
MSIVKQNRIYFIGIGGIGMSALARYFRSMGNDVAGYDRVKTDLCEELEHEGMAIHYEDNISLIPDKFKELSQKENILIVITPAVPNNHSELEWYRSNGFTIKKRAEILGQISENYQTVAVAGTHGKTSISSCIAHIFKTSSYDCNAFLGGITKNYNTNYLYSETSKYAIVEADEYDRSFLQLKPEAAIITAVDADHLDVYENKSNVSIAFNDFAKKIKSGGKLLIKKETGFIPNNISAQTASYSIREKADCYISELLLTNGKFTFNLYTPWGTIEKITPGVSGKYNVENCVAAASMCLWMGIDAETIKSGLASFLGVKRRFDIQDSTNQHVYIDDYAHHPEELKAFISSVKEVYPNKKITGIFQPHLYSRTRDFAESFGSSLSLLDELLLLDIYPAREEPISGISSKTIFDFVNLTQKQIVKKEQLLNVIEIQKPEVLLTMGAGDIDQMVEPIKKLMNQFS